MLSYLCMLLIVLSIGEFEGFKVNNKYSVASGRFVMTSTLDKAIVIQGTIKTGYGRGSKKLGFATANLPQFHKYLKDENIPLGVYCGVAKVGGESFKCVSNIGLSPTFVGEENRQVTIETHLINREKDTDLYEQRLLLILMAYIRPEKKFVNVADLKDQIMMDISEANEWIETNYSGTEIDAIVDHVSNISCDKNEDFFGCI